MANCPPKHLDTYKHLTDIFGEGRAMAAWKLANETIPTPKEAIQLLYPNVHPVDNYETMDFGSWAGKYEPDYEKQIENFILNHPDKPINGADSFNSFLDRSLGHFSHLLKTAPDNTVVVTHSSVLKAIRLWDEAGRPENLRLSNEDYVKEETQTGTVEPYKGANGTIWVVRHGETEDNKKENLRGPDTQLTDKGIKQAVDAGKELAGIQISELYCSPLDRAIHTTDLIMSQQEQPEYPKELIEKQLQEQKDYEQSAAYRNQYRRPNEVPTPILNSVEISQTPKVQQEWNKLQKGSITFKQFLDNSQFPRDQKPLLQDIYDKEHPKTINELITSFAAQYSYTVEINTAKQKGTKIGGRKDAYIEFYDGKWDVLSDRMGLLESFNTEKEAKDYLGLNSENPTQHYANMTVPGGTNYTENEISTPGITPSIKGHAQFSTSSGIGWFRSDEQVIKGKVYHQEEDDYGPAILQTYDGTPTKTRRILEVQSDLFQKGRNKEQLVNKSIDPESPLINSNIQEWNEAKEKGISEFSDRADTLVYNYNGYNYFAIPAHETITGKEDEFYKYLTPKPKDSETSSNNFLQLLNKDGNWIPFFIKSIVQDSAKKGYEKVLFPTGDTASKVEGHETLEQFKKQKEDRIRELEENNKEDILNWERESNNKEIKQLQEELKRVDAEGLATLKPIYNFYETRVKNTLDKIYGKDKVQRITDEHGNQWYQIDIRPQQNKNIYYSKEPRWQKGDTTGGQSYGDLIEPTYESFASTPVEQRYEKMSARKKELEAEGNRVTIKGSGLSWLPRVEQNINYQLDKQNKQLYELQSIINSAISGRFQEGTIKSAYSISSRGKGDIQKGQGRENFEKQLTKEHLWYKDELGEEIDGGVEHTVYKKPEDNTVTKVNATIDSYNDLQDYLQNMIALNYLFPETSYKLLGFRELQGRICPVTEQNYIKPSEGGAGKYNEDTINKVLALYGFYKVAEGRYRNDKGLTIWDINPTNVFFRDYIPFFIDPRIAIDRNFWSEEPVNPRQQPNNKLDKIVTGFVKAVGGNVKHIADTGQDWVERVDTLNGLVEVVNGRAGIETLGHAATHMMLDLLPDDSPLLRDILKDVKKREEYDDVYDRYKDDPQYHNADGSVNEEKMAKEAAAHIIDDAIVGKFLDGQSKKWWEKLWQWIKELFKGKEPLNPYEQVAEDILGKKTEKLSKEKLEAMKEANRRGEIYFQLSDKDKATVEGWKKGATEIQKQMIDELVTNNKMSLDIDTHTYVDATDPTRKWTPLTTAIKGHFDESIAAPNRETGTQLHSIMEAVVLGKKFDQIEPTDRVTDAARGMAYNAFQELVRNLKEDGSIIIPETIVTDKTNGIATSIDLVKIKPDGTRKLIDLKTSGKTVLYKDTDGKWKLSTDYMSKAWDVKEGSLIGGKLTTNQQHGIQVAAQDRILTNMGYPLSEVPETYHAKVTFKDGMLTHFEIEGMVSHPQTANTEFVDKILGPDTNKYINKPVDGDIAAEPTEEDAQKLERINSSLDKIKKEFTRRKASALTEMRETSINELKNTVSDIENLQNAGEVKEAMGRAIGYIQDLTRESLQFIANEKNFANRQYVQFLTESQILAGSNDELLPARLRKDLSDTQKTTFDSVKANLSELQEMAAIRMEQYFLQSVAPPSNPIDLNVLRKEWFPDEGIDDISLTGSWATNFDALRNPIIREAVHEIQVATKSSDMENVDLSAKWAKIGNDLALVAGDSIKNPKEFYKFLYNLDKDGKPTGYINPTADKYYDTLDRLLSALIDDKGERKKYIQISDLTTASAEDIQYNVDLFHAKQALNKFNSPEELNKDTGDIETGLYHHFNEDYTEARDSVMRPIIHTTWEGEPLYLEWVPKEGLNEDSVAVKRFRNRYMIKDKFDSMVMDKGKPTGAITQKEGWFPNRKYIAPNEFAGKEDMRNPRYVKLMTPATDLERAQKHFYQEFIKDFVDGAKKMGGEAERFVANRSLIALQSGVFQKAAKDGVVNGLKHQFFEFFTAVHSSNVESTDANGITRTALRIPHIGSLRSKEKIADIENRIAELGKEKTSLSKSAYNKQLKDLNIELERESHKLSVDDIEHDAVKQITAWVTGANTYNALESVEGKLMAAQWALKEQKFLKTTGRGIQKVDANGNPVFKAAKDVNAFRAMDQLIRNYYGISLDETNMGVALKRFQNLTSFVVMGLNWMNGINNATLYQINVMGQSLSGRYGLTAKNWAQGQKLLHTEYIPGLVRKALEKAGKYGDKQPKSKLESLVKQLAIKVDQKKAEGASGFFGKFYIFENLAIDLSQVSLAANGMLDIQIPNHATGETSSIYDAFTYDPNTGISTLQPGYDMNDITEGVVKIGDIQTQAQGNYQPITQPAMTNTILGQLLTQFHRFFATTWNNRASKRYVHRTLGETEGSWRSVISLAKILQDYEGDRMKDLFDKDSDLWKNMPDYIKKNLIFDAIDLVKLLVLIAIGAVLKGIAEEVSEDDPAQKRWMNFLAYTASRIRMEQEMFNPVFGWQDMAEFVQNPVAMSNTLKTFVQAMYLTAEFPFQTDDARYYHNGVFVGDSKAAHQAEKLIPVLRQTNQWLNHIKEQTQSGVLEGMSKH